MNESKRRSLTGAMLGETRPVSYAATLPEALRLRKIPVEALYGEIPVIRLVFDGEVIQGRPVVCTDHAGIIAHG